MHISREQQKVKFLILSLIEKSEKFQTFLVENSIKQKKKKRELFNFHQREKVIYRL